MVKFPFKYILNCLSQFGSTRMFKCVAQSKSMRTGIEALMWLLSISSLNKFFSVAKRLFKFGLSKWNIF